MENKTRIDELNERLEELYTERKNILDEIRKQEGEINLQELPETDDRYKNMINLKEKYSKIDIEIYQIEEVIANLKEIESLTLGKEEKE